MKKLKKLGKKGAFDVINNGMLSFITFVLITLLVILLVAVIEDTSIVTANTNASAAVDDMMTAAELPPQFAQIIVIVIIIVGILGMLGAIGYGVYRKMSG